MSVLCKTGAKFENMLKLGVGSALTSGTPVKVGFLTGVIEKTADANYDAVVNVCDGAVYSLSVRNVRTYESGAEATYGAIAVGDKIYFDASATMPSGVKLSTSPLSATDTTNVVFGIALSVEATATAKTSLLMDVMLGVK